MHINHSKLKLLSELGQPQKNFFFWLAGGWICLQIEEAVTWTIFFVSYSLMLNIISVPFVLSFFAFNKVFIWIKLLALSFSSFCK